MRSTRVLVDHLAVGDDQLALRYAELFVVVREGSVRPGPADWELTVQGSGGRHLTEGRHHLRIEAADGSVLTGDALLRFSDGSRHLFRGDGPLTGWPDPSDPSDPPSPRP